MRDRALWLLIPTSPPLLLRIVVGVALIAVATVAAYVKRRAQEISVGVVYLVAVFVVSTVWGLALGAVTAVLAVIDRGSAVGGERQVR